MRRSRPKFWIVFFILACFAFIQTQSFSANSKNWLTSKYDVSKIMSGNKFSIDFNGIQLIVNLVSVKVTNESKAQANLKDWLEGNQVTIIPEAAAGTSSEGFQRVYVFAFQGSNRVFVNQKLIEEGNAEYQKIRSNSYAKLQDAMAKSQKEQLKKSSTTSSSLDKEMMEKGSFKVVSELYSKKYHRMDCRWASMIHPQSQIIYDSYQDGELAKKNPCSQCCYSRVQEIRKQDAMKKKLGESEKKKTSYASTKKSYSSSKPTEKVEVIKNVGSIFGIKGDKFFYSPVSKKIRNTSASKLEKYSSLTAAKRSGRRPDPGSLRINNPVVPRPEGDECIGRRLPYLRPCRRSADHPTGLCDTCLKAE